MGFTRIESFDGSKGYIYPIDFPFTSVKLGEDSYLVNFNFGENPDEKAYRIVKDNGTDTALATSITNRGLIDKLRDQYFLDLDEELMHLENH